MNIEKIFSAKVLISINVAIIIIAELTGTFFLETGLIHMFAFAFLVLGISRIFVHYKTFDNYLRPFTWGAITALILFAVSHLHEYFAFSDLDEPYSDTLYTDVTNLYLTGIFLVALGAQYFIARRDNTWTFFSILGGGLLASVALSVLGFSKVFNISIEPDEPDIYVYSAIIVGVTALSIYCLLRIGKAVSIVKDFAIYIAIAFVLVTASALQYSLYEVLEHAGLPVYQIVYIGHFLFYAALSFIFLAFPKLVQRVGIYADLPNGA